MFLARGRESGQSCAPLEPDQGAGEGSRSVGWTSHRLTTEVVRTGCAHSFDLCCPVCLDQHADALGEVRAARPVETPGVSGE